MPDDVIRADTLLQAYYTTLLQYDSTPWASRAGLELARHYYVERDRVQGSHHSAPHLRLKQDLLHQRRASTSLLTGQVGSGKTMELARLASDQEVQDKLEVVHLDAEERLNLARFVDVRYLLVAFAEALAKRIVEISQRHSGNWGFASTEEGRIREWVRILSRFSPTEVADPSQLSPVELLQQFGERLTGVQARLRTDDRIRSSLRDETEVSMVQQLVGHLGMLLERVAAKRPLLLVDNTDKIRDPDSQEHLFNKHRPTLLEMPFHQVLTFPYELRYLPMGQLPIVTLPNVKAVERDAPDQVRPEALAFFVEVLGRRIESALVDEAAVERAVLLSAGIPREFLRLTRMAVLEAEQLGAKRVQPEHVNLAAAALRRDLQPQHAHPGTTLDLELVRLIPDKLNDRQKALLGALLIVEYTNGAQWYDVHPVLQEEYARRLAERRERVSARLSRDAGQQVTASTQDLLADLLAERERTEAPRGWGRRADD